MFFFWTYVSFQSDKTQLTAIGLHIKFSITNMYFIFSVKRIYTMKSVKKN